MSLGSALIDYLGRLTIVGGDRDGEPFELQPWEAHFCRGAFKDDGDAALSMARGNRKSALMAGIATATVDPLGTLTGSRFEAMPVASSFYLSLIIFEDALAFLRGLGHDL
ncbi:MAG: hypothetical protein OXN95_01475 [bacterium]|nr:hypothetical protein [bacterium]